MGLDTYFFKTTKEERNEKIFEILDGMQKSIDSAVKLGDTNLRVYMCDKNGYENKFLLELHPDIYWRKFNQATAWFSEKVLNNPKGTIEKRIGIVKRENLIRFYQDCKKILDKSVLSDGNILIDKSYCRKLFPCLTSVCFAGSSEYDERFLEDIRAAMRDVNFLLLTSNKDSEFIFLADY